MSHAGDITIWPCSRHAGVEISGVDVSENLGDAVISRIRQLLHQHGVVLFRDQQLDEAGHLRFSRRFGEPKTHIQFTTTGHPEIIKLSNIIEDGKPVGLADAGKHWHSDTSYDPEPEYGAVLYSREIPVPHANGETAGDTLFANAQSAYDALDEGMKVRLEGLKAGYSRSKVKEGSVRAWLTEEERRKVEVIHPVVRTHPATGRKAIYVNAGHTFRIEGLPPKEIQDLLNDLYERVAQPEFIYRHKWRVSDVLMWDNCVVQHNAVADYALPQRRLIHRIALKGSAPF